MSLATKVFAITGGASGMGASTCRLLAEKGAGVICVGDLESKGFAELQQSISKINPSTKVHCKTLDVSSSESVDEWIRDIVATFGDLHGAANVAGLPQAIGVRKIPAILEETDEAWDRILGVNLNGIFYCTRAEVRAMKQLPQGSRAIVNVASMASLQHNPDIYAYRTSKAACAHFTTSVAKDTNDLGIRINAVSPGMSSDSKSAQYKDLYIYLLTLIFRSNRYADAGEIYP